MHFEPLLVRGACAARPSAASCAMSSSKDWRTSASVYASCLSMLM